MKAHAGTNQHFSVSRWSVLLALHWADNRKRYLLALPAMAGLLLVWYSFLTIMDRFDPLDEGMQQVTYVSGLLVVGCLYASTIFSEFDSKAKGIAWLSVPASALEKLLCGLLFGVVIFFVAYNVVYYLIDIPMVRLMNELIVRQHRTWPGGYPVGPSKVYNVFTGKDNDPLDQRYHLYLLSYLAIQAAFLLGSIYFTRYAFIKTAVAVLIFVLCFTMLQSRVIEPALPGGFHRGPFTDWTRDDGTLKVNVIRISPLIEATLGFLLLYGVPPVFWITTYFRIKEKEV